MSLPVKKIAALGGIMAITCAARAEIPAILTDQIYKGQGVIDLLKDVSSADLSSYLQNNKAMYLAVDVNENASGTETARSQGVAIKQMKLILTTSAGDFSFSDFVTGTSAMLLESGSTVAQEYQTLFGTSGSNDLTSATTNFDMSRLDDVITFRNIAFTGDIKTARIQVEFLSTAATKPVGASEDFFDFSGGFEDFAILSPADAKMLEVASIGQADAPATVSYSTQTTPLTTTAATDPVPVSPAPAPADAVGNVPAAPAPPLLLLVFGAALLAIHQFRSAKRASVPS